MDKSRRFAFACIAMLFFIFGFITCLNDILIPHLKGIFSLNYTQAMLVQMAFFSAYFFFSIPSGFIVRKFGYANGIAIGLGVSSLGAFAFLPASSLHSYPIFLSALFVLACGITLLQVSANPYATALGKKESASARLNLVQAFNSLGTTIAPTIGSYLLLSRSSSQLAEEASGNTVIPYLVMGIMLLILVGIFKSLELPQITDASLKAENIHFKDKGHALHYPHLVFGVMAIFCYVGAEVGVGSFLVNYITDSWQVSLENAGKYISLYWGGAMVGRFVGTFFLNQWRPDRCLRFASLMACSLVSLAMISPSSFSPFFLLAVGFFNSIMFPVIFSLSIKGLGPYTSQGASYLCMAIVGGAILPYFQGMLADARSLQIGFLFPLLAYSFVAFFALRAKKFLKHI